MDTLADIGPALITLRRAKGMTQSELGRHVGASQQQIARWESRSYQNVDLKRVSAVAEALGFAASQAAMAAEIAAEPLATYGSPREATEAQGSTLEFSPAELRAVCSRRAVRRLALFGSVLRDDFGPDSDIDVLVEFDSSEFEGREVFRLPDELREVFGGRSIDVVEADSLRGRMRERVMAEAWDVFTA